MPLRRGQACKDCAAIILCNVEGPKLHRETNMQALRRSGESCMICSVLLTSSVATLEHVSKEQLEQDEDMEMLRLDVTTQRVQSSDSGVMWTNIETSIHHKKSGLAYPNTFVLQFCPVDAPCAKDAFWSAYPMSTDARLLKMRQWFQKCKSEHSGCMAPPSKLPRRLISIGTSISAHLTLVSTNGMDPRTIQYSTLSYCWGSLEVPGRTTRYNLESYSYDIPMDVLPRTIRDAVMISRSLDILYLWVDALCIVQGDIDDWRAEVTEMSSIYFGSALTIAASDAKDSAGGFFAEPPSTMSDSITAQSRSLFTVEGSGSDILVHVEARGNAPKGLSSILHTRGWTLQELALSHRTIQFTQSELQWRCRCAYWTESGMEYDPSATVYGGIPLLGSEHVRQPGLTWWKWIESYSARKLTVPSDRLPAIYGLIKYHQSVTRDTSVAGLWAGSLHQDLLWMEVPGLKQNDVPLPLLGAVPSWSWLSCSGGVYFDHFGQSKDRLDTTDHITIYHYDLTWCGGPYLSEIESSRLTLSGPAQEFFLEVAPEGRHFNPPYFLVDGETPSLSEHAIPWSCAAQFDRSQFRRPDKFLCILVRRGIVVDTGYRTETFLIIEPVTTSSEVECFRRIGLGMFRGYRDRFSSASRKTIDLI